MGVAVNRLPSATSTTKYCSSGTFRERIISDPKQNAPVKAALDVICSSLTSHDYGGAAVKPDFSVEHYDDLQHLLANGFLEQRSFARAVALQTINLGLGSLTDGQRSIFEAVITPALGRLTKGN